MRPLLRFCALASVTLACSAGATNPDEAGGEEIETGVDCATAGAFCGSGKCAVEVANQCKTPVTCQLAVESLCESNGAPIGPSTATSKKVTQLAGSTETLEAEPTCSQGAAVLTRVTSLACR